MADMNEIAKCRTVADVHKVADLVKNLFRAKNPIGEKADQIKGKRVSPYKQQKQNERHELMACSQSPWAGIFGMEIAIQSARVEFLVVPERFYRHMKREFLSS